MTARGRLREVLAGLPLPPANIAGLAVAVVLHLTRPWPMPGPRRLERPLGGVLVLAGSLIVAWATVERPETDIEHPERVTTTGPYRFSRNPMYVGWHLMHLGTSVSAGSTWGLFTLAAAMVEIHREIYHEEREMVVLFGHEFERYAATVPRYFGGRATC